MRNSAYHLLKTLKTASAMGAGSFLPPGPLPNSIKANQLEQQELAAQQGEANAGAGNEQLMQMQKAQEDAVNELQQTKQQLAQAQSELQNAQSQAQQQQQATQMQAQQEIQKAQMDAQYELQSEKIKNQQKLLSVQEKYMRAAGKQKPDQNHILGNQLKRVVKKVNSLKVASTGPTPLNPTGGPRDSVIQKKDSDIQANEKKFQGLPHSNVLPSQRTQEQWNEISTWKRNMYANDPKAQQIKAQVMSAPVKTPSLLSGIAGEVGSYWQDPKAYMQQNNPGLNDSLLWQLTGGFTTNVNSGFSNLAKGNVGRGLMDLGAGYAGGISTIGTGAGLLGGAAKLTAKALPSAAGGLTRFAGAAKNILPSALQGMKTQLALGVAPMFLASGGSHAGQSDASDMSEAYTNAGSGGGYGPGGGSYPGGFSAPQPQQRWDAGLSPSERFSILNQAQSQYAKSGSVDSAIETIKEPEYPDIRKFMKNPPPPGEAISSPVPIWQAGFKQHDLNMPRTKQQGYGPLGDFIKQLIFQVGLPMFGIRNPLSPDFSKVYGSLANNEAYKLKVPQTFNYY